MNRFRRQKSQKLKDQTNPASAGPPSTSAKRPLLPEANDFRTSLILPHLTKRFSLLQSESGQLLDIDTVRSHLAEQRKTGLLTEYESEAVLAQWQLQADQLRRLDAHTAIAHKAGWPVRPPRPEFNLIDDELTTESLAGSAFNSPSAASARSHANTPTPTSPIDWFEGSSVSSFSQQTPIPTSPQFSVSDGRLSPSVSAHPFRRGGANSMFGGRVATLSKMSKSSSASSLSTPRPGSAVTSRSESVPNLSTIATDGDNDDARSFGHRAAGSSSGHDELEGDSEDLTGTTEAEPEESTVGFTRELELEQEKMAAERPLSRLQLQRISLALDSIAEQISKSFSLEAIDDVAEGEAEEDDSGADDQEELVDRSPAPLSPLSEGEMMDPVLHQFPSRRPSVTLLGPAPPGRHEISQAPRPTFPLPALPLGVATTSPFLPPSASTADSSPTLRSAFVPSTSSSVNHSRSPSLASVSPSLGGSAFGPSHARNPSLASLASMRQGSSSIASRGSSFRRTAGTTSSMSVRSPVVQVSTTFAERPESSLDSHDARSPSAASSRVPSRLESAISDEGGPFDLALDKSSINSNRQSTTAASSAHQRVASIASAAQSLHSLSSVDSTGSSYHQLERPQSEAISVQLQRSIASSTKGDDADADADADADEEESLAPPSTVSFDPHDFSSASMDELVGIQESLVRSASRRAAAARRSPHGTPSADGEEFDSASRLPFEHQPLTSPELAGAIPMAHSFSQQSSTATSSAVTPGSGSAPTPSSGRSDAFEFASFVASPDPRLVAEEDHHEQLEHLDHRSLSPVSEGAHSASAPLEDADEAEEAPAVDEPNADADAEVEAAEEGDVVPEPTEAEAAPTRVAREGLGPRNANATVSVLVRDVRNQATLATIALKKSETGGVVRSPPTRSLSRSLTKSKSIKKINIGSPQLVSGTSDIPAVPIVNPALIPPTSPAVGRARSGSKSEGDALSRSKTLGVGSRFKKMLKKANHDTIGHLNGEEVTPFDFDPRLSQPPPVPALVESPYTPPNQAIEQFTTPEQHLAVDEPSSQTLTSDDALHIAARASGQVKALSPGMESHAGSSEHSSPMENLIDSSPSTSSQANTSPAPGRTLNRMISRLRGSRKSDASPDERALSPGRSRSGSRSATASPVLARRPSDVSGVRRRSVEAEPLGLGLGMSNTTESSRAATSYAISSPRLRHSPDLSLPPTEPLSLSRSGSVRTATVTSPTPHSTGSALGRVDSRDSAKSATESINSMRKLWEAAADLGLPRDKVQELVDLSYATSPTSSANSIEREAKSSLPESESFASSTLGHSGHRSTASESSIFVSGPAQRVMGRPKQPLTISVSDKRISKFSTSVSGSSLTAPITPGLRPAISPGNASVYSFRSSGYAGSVFDLYGGSEEGSNGLDSPKSIPDVPEMPTRRSGYFPTGAAAPHPLSNGATDPAVRYLPGEGGPRPPKAPVREETISFNDEGASGPGSPGEATNEDGEVVWSVLDDLRASRVSTLSRDESSVFGFDSPRSSLDATAPTEPTSAVRTQEALALLLRHHKRNQGSQGSLQSNEGPPHARYPSIFVRDERRLVDLARDGGVAPADEGAFMVRSKSGQELAFVGQ